MTMTTSAACRRSEREAEYRRGYADGWIVAVETFMELMTEGRTLSRVAAYARLFDHWEGPLTDRQREECRQLVLPPAVPVDVGRCCGRTTGTEKEAA